MRVHRATPLICFRSWWSMRVPVAVLMVGAACGAGAADATGPVPGGASLGYTFTPDAGIRTAPGVGPSTLIINGTIYLWVSGGGNSVLASTDGLSFTAVTAAYPPGSGYNFVALPGGGWRMYYFDPPTSRLLSATSSDGLHWTSEPGTRITLSSIAVPKVVATPGGYRVYYTVATAGIQSAFSVDGLTFTTESGNRLQSGSGFRWGDPAVVYTGSQWLMLATSLPNDASYSSIWLATSADGLTWTLDSKALITNTTGSPVDASFSPITGGYRIYHGLVVGGSAGSTTGNTQVLSGTLTR